MKKSILVVLIALTGCMPERGEVIHDGCQYVWFSGANDPPIPGNR